MVVWVRRLRTFVLVSLNHPFNFEVQPARYSWKTFLFLCISPLVDIYRRSCRDVGQYVRLEKNLHICIIWFHPLWYWPPKEFDETINPEERSWFRKQAKISRDCCYACMQKIFHWKCFSQERAEKMTKKERERKVFTNFALLLHGVNINKEERIFELHIFSLLQSSIVKSSRITIQHTTFISF